MGGLRLGVNVDHIATLRQARYASMPDKKNAEPDLVAAAAMYERAGAQGIVAHLRSDRRHMQDRDIDRLRQNIMTKLNLEMGNTPEIVDVALRIVPDEICLVPEKREEVTTEGGLDVVVNRKELEPTIKRLQTSGIRVSLFVDPTASELKLQVNAGHGINYTNIALIHKVSHLTELNIGHSIISRAVVVGLESAVKEMIAAMADYPG